MEAAMKKSLPAWAVLGIITLIAGLALGGVYALTKDAIAERNVLAAQAARMAVLPEADSFTEQTPPEGLDAFFLALKGDAVIGKIGVITVKGYGGDIEIVVGVNMEGVLQGISVGGSDFNETVGLGARVKEGAFTSQFTGKSPPLTVNADVDAVTGATISSRAVTDGVNHAAALLEAAE
jgi:electron transport complex protein RnfG